MKTSLLLAVALLTIVSIFAIDAKPMPGQRMILKGSAHRCILEKSCISKDWRRTETTTSSIADEEIEMMIFPRLKNADQIESMLFERSTPGSPLFRQWLSFDEVADYYKDNEAVERVEEWLKINGVKQIKTAPNGEFVKIVTTISNAERMLDTKYHVFESETLNGAQILRAESYSLPESVFEFVDLISGVSSFPATHTRPGAFRSYETVNKPDADGNTTPQLITSFYGMTTNTIKNTHLVNQSLFESLGQSYSPSDLTKFEQQYNIPTQAIETVIGPNNPNACTQNPNNCGEANLDVQYLISVAQGAPTVFWSIPNSNTADIYLEWITALAADSSAPLVHSMSYGSIESEEDSTSMNKFNQLAGTVGQRGITIMVASGDDGVANFLARSDPSKCGFNPSFPATSPYVTAVGATQGPEAGQPEIACSSATGGLITTGGGFSGTFSQPSYQSSAVQAYFSSGVQLPPSGQYNAGGRGYPDVAMLGHNYMVYIGGQLIQVSGTSASTPVFAGVISLANDALASAGQGSLGFINPTLYTMSASAYNDITSGENNCCAGNPGSQTCCSYGFYATSGWDPLTGFGSVSFTNFINGITNGHPPSSTTRTTSGSGSKATSGSTQSGSTSQSGTTGTGAGSSSSSSTGSGASSTGTGSKAF